MKKLKNPSTFAIGLIFGALIGLIIWYWYKSTSAEDGALDLLDRMAVADTKIRDLKSQLKAETVENYITLEPNGGNDLPPFLVKEAEVAEASKEESEDLQQIKGIGPVYAQKLQAAGINTVAKLTAVSPAQLAEILNTTESRAEAILAAAK